MKYKIAIFLSVSFWIPTITMAQAVHAGGCPEVRPCPEPTPTPTPRGSGDKEENDIDPETNNRQVISSNPNKTNIPENGVVNNNGSTSKFLPPTQGSGYVGVGATGASQ